jgi:Tfp pilus assembly protein PilV
VLLRNRHAATRGRRWRFAKDDGFSLIEVIVALGILMIVMLSTAGFFVQSLKTSSTQAQQQEAAQLATQQLDYSRSVPAKALLYGRTQALVQVATNSPGITDLSQDVISGFNYDGWDGTSSGQASQVVPINMPPQTVSGTVYNVTTFIDRCYVSFGTNQQCVRAAAAGSSWLFRISVNVSWKPTGGRTCPTASKACQFVASTLRDPGTDPCFNVNVDFAGCSPSQPSITSFNPSTVTTNTTTNMTLTGINFDPGAKLTIDSAVGTITNVLVVNATTITFTLTTANTPAAVGSAQVIRVTNLNGKYGLGTITVNTSNLNANTASPATVYTGATTAMVITGSGFQPGTLVSVPAADGTIVGTPVVTATTISLNFLAGSGTAALGSATYTVTNPDGATDTVSFTVAKALISLTGISPATQVYGTSRTYVLTGSAFNAGAQVTLDGAAVAEVVNSSTTITVTLTFDPVVSNTHSFVVSNPDGGTANKSFAVTVNPITVTDVSPDPSLYTNRSFTITGTGFKPTAQVTLNGSAVTESWVSATTMTVTLTANLAYGTNTFAVTNPDLGSDSETFTAAKAHIASFSPNASPGVARGSRTVTITGTNFSTTGTTPPKVSVGGTLYTLSSITATTAQFTFNVLSGTNTYTVQITAQKDGTVSDIASWTVKGT